MIDTFPSFRAMVTFDLILFAASLLPIIGVIVYWARLSRVDALPAGWSGFVARGIDAAPEPDGSQPSRSATHGSIGA